MVPQRLVFWGQWSLPNTGAKYTLGKKIGWFSTFHWYFAFFSGMTPVQHRHTTATEYKQEVIPKLSNGAIYNDLPTPFSKFCVTFVTSGMHKDRDSKFNTQVDCSMYRLGQKQLHKLKSSYRCNRSRKKWNGQNVPRVSDNKD